MFEISQGIYYILHSGCGLDFGWLYMYVFNGLSLNEKIYFQLEES